MYIQDIPPSHEQAGSFRYQKVSHGTEGRAASLLGMYLQKYLTKVPSRYPRVPCCNGGRAVSLPGPHSGIRLDHISQFPGHLAAAALCGLWQGLIKALLIVAIAIAAIAIASVNIILTAIITVT